MEHNPYITLNDDTEITYSDIKNDKGYDYVTIYFETPDTSKVGFSSTQYDYPGGHFENTVGYSDERIRYFQDIVNRIGDIVVEWAIEEMEC